MVKEDNLKNMNSKIEDFFNNQTTWKAEMDVLRSIALDCNLNEELKWKVPCYTYKGNNIFIIHGFKEYCAINFFKGALLKDDEKILVQQTKNVQATRQIRFTGSKEISALEKTLKAYIFEAIEVEKAGLKINYKKTDDFEVPIEFAQKLKELPELEKAFKALTSGRQKGYLLYFTGAKQAKTREARIEKYIPRIMNGIGFNDCVCGKSKRMPNCDGSHNK